jgi:AmpD protein
MRFTEYVYPSPCFTPTPAHEQRGVCFHHSVLAYEDALAYLLNVENQVSYHVLIAPDGSRACLVADEHIAWHAGASLFQGRSRCNDFLLGVSFAGDTRAAPLTEAQIDSALDWLEPRWSKHGWTLAMMTDHRQIAPVRKDDLVPTEWIRLQTAIHERFDVDS